MGNLSGISETSFAPKDDSFDSFMQERVQKHKERALEKSTSEALASASSFRQSGKGVGNLEVTKFNAIEGFDVLFHNYVAPVSNASFETLPARQEDDVMQERVQPRKEKTWEDLCADKSIPEDVTVSDLEEFLEESWQIMEVKEPEYKSSFDEEAESETVICKTQNYFAKFQQERAQRLSAQTTYLATSPTENEIIIETLNHFLSLGFIEEEGEPSLIQYLDNLEETIGTSLLDDEKEVVSRFPNFGKQNVFVSLSGKDNGDDEDEEFKDFVQERAAARKTRNLIRQSKGITHTAQPDANITSQFEAISQLVEEPGLTSGNSRDFQVNPSTGKMTYTGKPSLSLEEEMEQANQRRAAALERRYQENRWRLAQGENAR